MRPARRSKFGSLVSALVCATAILSCGGDSTGPGGGNSGVTVTPSSDSLAVGSSVTLSAKVTDAAGHTVNGASIFWNTENAAVATVSGTGVVVGIAVGTVRIAASSGGMSGFSTITVIPPGVASVNVTPSGSTIKVGETVHLVAQTLDAAGAVLTGRTVTWSSSNTDVATVDNTGVVTGVSVGGSVITATSEGKSGTAAVAVNAVVAASITVAPPSVTITTGQTSQLTATVKDANGAVISGAPVSWTVDNSGVALVGSTGLVTGQAPGTATVTATSGAAHIGVPITVTLPPANAVIVSPSSVALLVTQTQQLTATVTDAGGHTLPGQSVAWQSNNTGVATVSPSGVVTAVSPGSATITGTSGAASGVALVTVSLVPVRRVVVTPDVLAFTQGAPGSQLTVTLLDSIGGTLSPVGRPVTFSSNNTGVATVSGTGFVSPGGPGQAVITVTQTGSGFSATATVTVTQVPVASVTITPALDTLTLGQVVQLAATTKDGNGNTLTGRVVVWDGSDDNVAIVSSTGKVTSHAPGTMTVTATSEGKTGTATIVVIAVPVASVTISPSTQTVVVGATTPAFTAVTKDGSNNVLTGRVVTFTSSDPTIATIDANSGVATGVAPGTTSITATSEGINSTPATLTVTPIPVASVTISPLTQSVIVGLTTPAFTAVTKDGGGNTLTGRTVTFSSSDLSIATVDASSGVATGVAAGTASITASSEGKNSTPATLTVTAAPVGSVTILPTNASVVAGANTPAFTAEAKDGNGNTLTGRPIAFSSSDLTIATVNSSTGVATGVAPGGAMITASSGGKNSSPAALTVTPVPVDNVVLAPPSQSVDVGSTVTFTATPRDASNNPLSGRTVVYGSSDPTIASINSSTGVALGVAPGTVTIGAISETKNATASLTVNPVPVASVDITPLLGSASIGGTFQFTATPRDASNNALSGRVVTWTSSDATLATVDNTGLVTAVAVGVPTITATSEGVNSVAAPMTVLP